MGNLLGVEDQGAVTEHHDSPQYTGHQQQMLGHILRVEDQGAVAVHDGQEGTQAPVLVVSILAQPHALDAGGLPVHRLGYGHLKGRAGGAATQRPLSHRHLKGPLWSRLPCKYCNSSDQIQQHLSQGQGQANLNLENNIAVVRSAQS